MIPENLIKRIKLQGPKFQRNLRCWSIVIPVGAGVVYIGTVVILIIARQIGIYSNIVKVIRPVDYIFAVLTTLVYMFLLFLRLCVFLIVKKVETGKE